VARQTGERFPLLIKLLDCAQWLSLQVHPNDEQAARLEGPGYFGKTEAWHVLEAVPGAQLIAGVKPGTRAVALSDAIRSGTILDISQYITVHAGDSIFMRAGTVHALGPGLLVYEVQQTSDLTYRVFDWNRPQTGRRVLHIEKSLAVVDPNARAEARPCPPVPDGGRQVLVTCPYFTLEVLAAHSQEIPLDTLGQTFHALTVIEGAARLLIGEQTLALNRYQSAVVPADVGAYTLQPLGSCRVLKSSVE
jgi:mannose-6-phosphate isomerase